ncbi:MAG: ABC transporter ATP-binding protein [Verrucomicrobiales bacterium]
MSAPALRIRDLRVDYGDTIAVRGLDLEVPAGEVFGLIGPNGAGKTSTFRVAATLMEPTHGDVEICGVDVALRPDAARTQLGYMPDLAPVASDLKVWEFLDLFAASHGFSGDARQARVSECLAEVRLTEKRDAFCRQLSRGMMQRLVLAKTMLHRPNLMILDEPASGMDPPSRAHLRQSLRKMAADGAAVVVSSHILSELADMCTSVGILSKGSLLASGTIASVVESLGANRAQVCARFAEIAHASRALDFVKARLAATAPSLSGDRLQFELAGGASTHAEIIAAFVNEGLSLAAFEVRSGTIEDVILSLEGDAS